ncbi:MAG: polysaccharide deacetylase family protein [Rhodospirillales bacterium]|jgi:peptidoglycan/xylan/chitin deacetylase (PgdA/CDA1 family)|nr:polysaccharide deacetylase [Rhodospirillaceae bacterium]MDP6426932.1 polysaccharide deacetylase family protein [Rhodospirillales bacterium]MDP6645366.1 polysaccharide deacetylase family protein [Rhodospirillales bacterium]MDP6842610.1 polysaccharide deacetylase family protein [Rhodospirillales bacterium]
MGHGRFEYSAIVDRPPLKLPGGAHVGLWVIPNIEHFLVDRPATSITSVTVNCVPDVLNYAWRDFGVRVGIWRLMEVMEKHGIKGTVALNSDVCHHYPRIIEAGNELGWEWMGHGRNNSEMITGLEEAEERAILGEVYSTIETHTGTKPRGWLGPALTETFNTPDILAEVGFDYVGDWVNDEQPHELNVKSGRLLSVPYSIEVNDIPAFVDRGWSAEQFYQTIVDQFDVMYADGEANGRIMAIALHPFLIGHAFRSKYLDMALAHITGHDKVWLTTGAEIADWYRSQRAAG